MRKQGMRTQDGFSLMEVLFTISILSIVGLTLTESLIMLTKSRSVAINKQYATQLAVEKIEEYASVDASTLSVGSQGSETVTRDGRNFTRSATISVNSFGAKSVTVEVRASAPNQGGAATLSSSLTTWSYS